MDFKLWSSNGCCRIDSFEVMPPCLFWLLYMRKWWGFLSVLVHHTQIGDGFVGLLEKEYWQTWWQCNMDVIPLLCGAFQRKKCQNFMQLSLPQLNMHICSPLCVEASHLFNPLLLAGVIEGENVWDIGRSWHSQKCLDFHYFVSRQYCMRNASSIKSFTKRLVLR